MKRITDQILEQCIVVAHIITQISTNLQIVMLESFCSYTKTEVVQMHGDYMTHHTNTKYHLEKACNRGMTFKDTQVHYNCCY